jgi:hypothetical protein
MAPPSTPRKPRKADKQKGRGTRKGSTSFCEQKEAKKLFYSGLGALARPPAMAQIKGVFCAAFFQKSGCLLTSA